MLKYSHTDLDETDLAILDIIQHDGRVSNAELARRVSLSPPATHVRVRRLEEQGFIEGYVALLNRERLGFDLLCLVQVSLTVHQFEQVQEFRKRVSAMPEVLECYHITGEFDYLLKVALRNRKDLERFVVNELTPLSGVSRIYSSLVLTEVKIDNYLPLS